MKTAILICLALGLFSIVYAFIRNKTASFDDGSFLLGILIFVVGAGFIGVALVLLLLSAFGVGD